MAKYRASKVLLSAQAIFRSCDLRLELLLANCRQPQDPSKNASQRCRERLVPAKRRANDKTRGRGRSRPILERTLRQPDHDAILSPADVVGRHWKQVAAQMFGLLIVALLLMASPPGRAEGGSLWRIYPVTAGRGGTFAVAVTVSPRGN